METNKKYSQITADKRRNKNFVFWHDTNAKGDERMKLCSRCKKNIAVIFVTKIDGGVSQNQGLCVQCARELGLKQVDDIMEQMGIDPEEASASMQAMMEQMGIDEDNMDEMDDKIKEMIKEWGLVPRKCRNKPSI